MKKFKASDFEKGLERTYQENVKPDYKPGFEEELFYLGLSSLDDNEKVRLEFDQKELEDFIRQTIKEELEKRDSEWYGWVGQERAEAVREFIESNEGKVYQVYNKVVEEIVKDNKIKIFKKLSRIKSGYSGSFETPHWEGFDECLRIVKKILNKTL